MQVSDSLISKIFKRVKLSLQVLLFRERYSIYPQQSYAYHNLSFSQEGEDLILKRIFNNQKNGLYVDIGAHHPQRFSNTYLFYLQGWRGINIDAMPGSMEPFSQLRPEDINIEAAISDSLEELTYYIYNEPALNTFSEELTIKRESSCDYKIINKKQLKTQKLSEILDEHLGESKDIDFMSIDVEGLDKKVLFSNDWTKYRPQIILIEELSSSFSSLSKKSEVFLFLSSKGYELFAKTFNTSFYRKYSI